MAEQNQVIDAVAHNKAAIIEALKPHGIKKVIVEYYGGGDSGGAEDVRLELENGETVPVPTGSVSYAYNRTRYNFQTKGVETIEGYIEKKPLTNALEDFAMHLVEIHHAGWENDDGGRGDVTFDLDENEIVVDHEEYYTESNSYSHSF